MPRLCEGDCTAGARRSATFWGIEMSDLRTTLERGVGSATPPPDGFERMLRRRDRKRRNQRIAAGVVGFAVFLAGIWIVTTGGPFDRALTPVDGGTVTGPTVMEARIPEGSAGAGLMGLPPQGAVPSTPTSGELVLSFLAGHGMGDGERFGAHLYADGRLIWTRLTNPAVGLIEQRLTPEGVDLIRSEVLSTGLFDHDLNLLAAHGLYFGQIEVREGNRFVRVIWGACCDPESSSAAKEMPTPGQASALQRLDVLIEDPASWLPASAWEDPEMRPYVPTRYSVCFDTELGTGLDRVLASLPRAAEDLLRSWDRTHEVLPSFTGLGSRLEIWCSDVSTEEAREFAGTLEDAHLEQRDRGAEPGYVSWGGGIEVSIGLSPKLPDDVA